MSDQPDSDYRHSRFAAVESPLQKRLIIGIIGHHNLCTVQRETYLAQCTASLQALQQRHPKRTLEIMSALAPGAERIGAQAALRLGLRLIVLLPPDLLMLGDPDESSESTAEYRALLAQIPIQNFQIPAPDTHGDSSACCADDLTRLIVSESQVLIALWDGQVSEWPGDTADLIDTKLQPGRHEMPETDAGPVLHLSVRRAGATHPPMFPLPVWLYPPDAESSIQQERRRRFSALV